MKVIYVDVDGTVCDTPTYDGKNIYYMSTPIEKNIKKINILYDEGNEIVYWSARGNTTKNDWTEFTRQQLKKWGAKFTRLEMNNKPSFDLLIDDKAISIDNL